MPNPESTTIGGSGSAGVGAGVGAAAAVRVYTGLVFVADFHAIFARLGGAAVTTRQLDGLDLWDAIAAAGPAGAAGAAGTGAGERDEIVAQLDSVDGSTAIIVRVLPTPPSVSATGGGRGAAAGNTSRAVPAGLWKLLLSVQDAPHYPDFTPGVGGCPEPLWRCGQHGWSGGNGSCLEGSVVDRLYELDSDPTESRNRLETEPEVVALLRERLGEARAGGVLPFCGGCTREFWRSEPAGTIRNDTQAGYLGVMCCGDGRLAQAAAVRAGGIAPWVQ